MRQLIELILKLLTRQKPQEIIMQPTQLKLYYTLAGDVDQTPYLDKKCNWFGEIYFQKTGKLLVVTSGRRDSRRQADAMYTNFRNEIVNGAAPVAYSKVDAEKEIRDVFMKGYRTPNYPREKIVQDMIATINSQIQRGIYISRHLPTKENPDGIANDFSLENDYKVMESIAKDVCVFIMGEALCIHVSWG